MLQAAPLLAARTGTLVLLSGDVPLLSAATLTPAARRRTRRRRGGHRAHGRARPRPAGYGRIVREDGRIARIVEERDASADERAIREINSGVYAFDLEPLFPALQRIASDERTGRVLPARSRRDLPPAAAAVVETVDGASEPRRSAASTAAPSWPQWGRSCDSRRTKS